MVKEHIIGSTVVKINKKVLVEFFNKLVSDYRNLKDLDAALKDYDAGNIDEDELLDDFDNIHFISPADCAKFGNLRICSFDSINIYLSRVASIFCALDEKVHAIATSYCAPDKKETEVLLELLYKTIAGFCFVFGNEFHCFDTVISEDSDDQYYDEIVFHHFSKYAIDDTKRGQLCMNFAKGIATDAEEFKIKLDVFDAAPEKEEPFMNLVGPDVCIIDETALTMEMVDAVLDGKMTVDELLSQCSYADTEDEDTTTTVTPGMIEV